MFQRGGSYRLQLITLNFNKLPPGPRESRIEEIHYVGKLGWQKREASVSNRRGTKQQGNFTYFRLLVVSLQEITLPSSLTFICPQFVRSYVRLFVRLFVCLTRF